MVEERSLTACRWAFDDGPTFDGFADGTRWNGFDNISITPSTREEVVAWVREDGGDPSDIEDLPVGADGLVSLAFGFTTSLVEEGGYE